MKQLFYFNGFNSAILPDYSGNPKIMAVAEYCQRAGFRFQPVSIRYIHVGVHRDALLQAVDHNAEAVVFCGSSMGGWFARVMQLTLIDSGFEKAALALAFNPAHEFVRHGEEVLGTWTNYVSGERYEWTQAHSDRIRELAESVNYDSPAPFFVYCDKGDEVIDWEGSAARHLGISRFVAYEGGSHSFEHYREALEDFDRFSPRKPA
jgi:predicted esterase YcpF (UPF0227 family)